jgi:hypothetical protein
MEEATGIAEVIRVTKHPVFEIAEGVEVGGYTVQAKMETPADQYSHDLFLVRISKPAEFKYLQHAKGLLMQDGKFSFNSGEELKIGDKLEILISQTPPENPVFSPPTYSNPGG